MRDGNFIDPGCSGKTRYANKAEAIMVIIHRKRERRVRCKSGRGNIHTYRCVRCKFWHIGSDPIR